MEVESSSEVSEVSSIKQDSAVHMVKRDGGNMDQRYVCRGTRHVRTQGYDIYKSPEKDATK